MFGLRAFFGKTRCVNQLRAVAISALPALAFLTFALQTGEAFADIHDWRTQRFEAVAKAGEALARQYFPSQRERSYTYVNWRHLDGDGSIDALVIVKSTKASCSMPSARCVAAVLTTGSASSVGELGVLGAYFPAGEPTFVRTSAEGVQLFIPENRNNFVEVLLPRRAGEGWKVTPEKRTRRIASGDGSTIALDEDDFILLDLQQASLRRMSAASNVFPAGAPFIYVGETGAPDRDEGARAVQYTLDRLAAGRILDSAPVIDFSRCLSGLSITRSSLAQFMARSVSSAEKARSIVVCVDEVPANIDADSRKIIELLWDTRLWTVLVQVASSYADQPLRVAAERSGVEKSVLTSLRALSDLSRFARLDIATALHLLEGLSDLIKSVPESVASESQRFRSQVFTPALLAMACSLRDVSSVDRDADESFSKIRRENQATCDRAAKAVSDLL